jgi:N-acetylmuramoyl-L-alanine amidase
VLAAEANRYAADLFLAFRAGDAPGCRCSYYESGRFRSEAGHAVADAVSRELAPIIGGDACVAGRTYAVLRETRMAAVICEPVAADDVATMRTLVVRGAEVAQAVVRGVRRGVEQPSTEASG